MAVLLSCVFAFLVLFACLFIAWRGRKWNLTPLTAFSSGGLLSLTCLDFLPHSFEKPSLYTGSWILLGILIQGAVDLYGSGYLKFLDRWIEEPHSDGPDHHHSHILSPSSAVSTVGCLTVCSFFDGVRFYSGLTMDHLTAIALSVGLFFHLLSEGVMTAVLGINSRLKQRVLFTLIAFMCGTFILGTSLAKWLSDYWSPRGVLSFSTGILIYICSIHLIPFCLKNRKEGWFALGLVLFSLNHFLAHSF